MGHRTLSLRLVLRALFLDSSAYDELRHDDNPYVEGMFLVVILGVATALLRLVGEIIAWASTPSMDAIKQVIFNAYQKMPWWSQATQLSGFEATFRRYWDLIWRIFPSLFGAPTPGGAALNILTWPVVALVSWLIYGVLAHLFARLLKGEGTLNQTLGTTALAFSPLMFRGLEIIPFVSIGAAITTWQLICRYKAVRSAHRLPWQRAFWATVLPFAIYLVFWLLVGGLVTASIVAIAGR